MTTYVLPLNPTEVQSDFDALGADLTWIAERVNIDFGFFPPGQSFFGSAVNGSQIQPISVDDVGTRAGKCPARRAVVNRTRCAVSALRASIPGALPAFAGGRRLAASSLKTPVPQLIW